MQIWKSLDIFVFTWKWYADVSTILHILISEICGGKICKIFVYKLSETIEYVKN